MPLLFAVIFEEAVKRAAWHEPALCSPGAFDQPRAEVSEPLFPQCGLGRCTHPESVLHWGSEQNVPASS